jgi:hypothetical protein
VLSLPDYFLDSVLSLLAYLFSMAAIVITAQQETEAFNNAGSDLIFLMNREGVDRDIQAKLYHIGVISIKGFAALVDDKVELRKVLKGNFELDAEANLLDRVKCSRVLVAWDSAKARSVKLAEAEGDAEARGLPKEISSNDGQIMRLTFEMKYGDLSEREVPGRSYLERKLDEVEKSDFRAESLTEVISKEEDEPGSINPVWAANGQLTAMKVSTKVNLPADTEGFRKRLALLGTAWCFVATHQAGRGILRGITPALFKEYTEYLLGDYVLGLTAHGRTGAVISTPSWSLVVAYEHAIRAKTMMLLRKGDIAFPAALKTAWEDALTKERHFTTPLALEAVKFAPPQPQWQGPPGNWDEPSHKKLKAIADGSVYAKGSGKGGGGGKGTKSKDAKKKKKAQGMQTPDGKKICFHFNKASGCRLGTNCKFAHACGRCFAPNISSMTCTCH